MIKKLIFLLQIALLASPVFAEPVPDSTAKKPEKKQPDLKAILAAIQSHYDKVKDFSAEFTQEFHHKVLKKKDSSKGNVKFRKPGLMRWDYVQPSEKSFVVDGKSLWIYQPKDKSVMVDRCFKQDTLTASLSFLWGEGNILKQFDAKLFEGKFGSESDVHVQLTPKLKSPYYKRMILVIDPVKNHVKMSVVVDLEGNVNQFSFSNIHFDSGLKEQEFVFKTPKGAVESDIPGSDKNCNIDKIGKK